MNQEIVRNGMKNKREDFQMNIAIKLYCFAA